MSQEERNVECCTLKMERGAVSQGTQAATRSRKSVGNGLPAEFPRGNSSVNTSTLAQ